MTQCRTFQDFWIFYLQEHSRPQTRILHYVGTSFVLLLGLAALFSGNWWLLLLMPVAGYGFAWISHAVIEHNRPATFTYPLWSLAADFRMWWLWLTGKLPDHLRAAGIEDMKERNQIEH